MGIQGERWVLKHHFQGMPKQEDFELVKEDLGELEEGEIAYQAEFLSVDPYMRPYVASMSPPFTMIGSQVALVTESRDPDYPADSRVVLYTGWVRVGKYNPKKKAQEAQGLTNNKHIKPPAIHGLSPSHLLGACGMPGNTAYFGLLELCQPKKGETVVVNGAAGAVGSLVGQIAKLQGCTVIGYAGTDEKVAWLKELGFDHAFNYKKTTTAESLKLAAPNGVDCFFDNVGGSDSSVVMGFMNLFGRIAVCGSISSYNEEKQTVVPAINGILIHKQLKMEGFLVTRWGARWNEGITAMAQLIQEGKVKTRETVVEGFENMPKAFMGLFTGDNIGKMVVKC